MPTCLSAVSQPPTFKALNIFSQLQSLCQLTLSQTFHNVIVLLLFFSALTKIHVHLRNLSIINMSHTFDDLEFLEIFFYLWWWFQSLLLVIDHLDEAFHSLECLESYRHISIGISPVTAQGCWQGSKEEFSHCSPIRQSQKEVSQCQWWTWCGQL